MCLRHDEDSKYRMKISEGVMSAENIAQPVNISVTCDLVASLYVTNISYQLSNQK